MFRRVFRLTAGAALAAAVVLLSGPARADDDEKEIKQAAEAVKKLAGNLDAGDVTQQAAAVARANDIEYVMHQFKPRNKGGLGVGAKAAPPGVKDGIELAINDIGKNGIAAETLKNNKEDLLQMTRVARAVAEVNSHYPPTNKAGARKENWKVYTDEMKAGSKDLADAIQGGSPDKVRAAANKLAATCDRCHTEFR
jgi:hypothetical protein